MRKFLFIILVGMFMSIMFTACPEYDSNCIWLKNNSNKNIVAYIGGDDLGEPFYPDTLLPSENQTRHVPKIDETQYFFKKDIRNNKVCVFFLDQDTITKYGWDKVRDNYMILKRYDVDEKYLRQKEINWTIVYEDSVK